MIALSTSAQAAYANLVTPPTHALLVSQTVNYQPWNGLTKVRFEYRPGNLDGSGAFVPNIGVAPIVVTMPGSNADLHATEIAIMAILLGAGTVPSAADPTVAIAVPAKKYGDWQMRDVDVVVVARVAALAGTIVTP